MLSKLYCAPVVCLILIAGTLLAKEVPREIFNGKDLQGWEGDPTLWSVENGAIVGRTTDDNPIKNNTFLIWKDGKVGDFRLTFEYKIEGGNSGVQYRSNTAPWTANVVVDRELITGQNPASAVGVAQELLKRLK